MFDYVMRLINSGDYELASMLDRIYKLFAAGRVSEDESNQLIDAARENADCCDSLPPVTNRLMNCEKSLKALEKRVKALEEASGEEEPEPEDEYPAWHAPTGAHDAYFAGDKMTYTDRKRYTCIAPDGVACVWGPDVMPSYWQCDGDAPSTDDEITE